MREGAAVAMATPPGAPAGRAGPGRASAGGGGTSSPGPGKGRGGGTAAGPGGAAVSEQGGAGCPRQSGAGSRRQRVVPLRRMARAPAGAAPSSAAAGLQTAGLRALRLGERLLRLRAGVGSHGGEAVPKVGPVPGGAVCRSAAAAAARVEMRDWTFPAVTVLGSGS